MSNSTPTPKKTLDQMSPHEMGHALRSVIAPVFMFVEMVGPQLQNSDLRDLHAAAVRSLEKFRKLLTV